MDKRVIKTKTAIRDVFFDLIKEKELTKITVAEISRRANIDRKTFYLHYTSVEEILEEFSENRVRELVERLKETDFFDEPLRLEIIFDVLNDMVERDFRYYKELAVVGYNAFWDRVHQLMVEALMNVYGSSLSVSSEDFKLYCNFFVSGVIYMYKDYLRDPEALQPERLGRIMIDIAAHGVSGVLRDVRGAQRSERT